MRAHGHADARYISGEGAARASTGADAAVSRAGVGCGPVLGAGWRELVEDVQWWGAACVVAASRRAIACAKGHSPQGVKR